MIIIEHTILIMGCRKHDLKKNWSSVYIQIVSYTSSWNILLQNYILTFLKTQWGCKNPVISKVGILKHAQKNISSIKTGIWGRFVLLNAIATGPHGSSINVCWVNQWMLPDQGIMYF